MNSDGKREARLRRRERRAAESSVDREMRLARRRVEDRARYARAVLFVIFPVHKLHFNYTSFLLLS